MFRATLLALAAVSATFGAARAEPKTTLVVGMTLEPPGLDPTAGAAAAIGEITQYNLYEGLTKVSRDRSVTPLLAEGWTASPDGRTYTFRLRTGVTFQDGQPFTSADVKFAFERAAAPDSTNKDKAIFAGLAVETPDAATAILRLKTPDPDLPFRLAQPTAAIVDPKSAPTNATHPVGTGPFRFESWNKGDSVTLVRWPGFRDAAKIALTRATFRIINDPAAQVAALLAGDVDVYPRFGSMQSVAQFRADPRFTVTVGGTEGKTILAINNRRKPLDDVRVRRALAYAIDRNAVIEGAMNGFGAPIGSHAVPGDPGYVDLTGVYPHDPAKARALLAEAGVRTPLSLTLTLPPPSYARDGGQIIAAELAEVGIDATIQEVEWAQWLSGVLTNRNFDLTVISHVEPLDLGIYADPNYYFGYDSPALRKLLAAAAATADPAAREKLLGDAQRRITEDAVNVFLFQLPQVTVAAKGLRGLATDSPVFANDLTGVSWQ